MLLKVVFVMCLFCIPSAAQTSQFYEQIVDHLDCGNCFFVSINIRTEKFQGRVVVENDDLFKYLHTTQEIDEKTYKKIIKENLAANSFLILNNVDIDESGIFLVGDFIDKYDFRLVKKSPVFEDVSAKGCGAILRYYFSPIINIPSQSKNCRDVIRQNKKDLLIKPLHGLAEQNNLIASLFDMGIPVYIDDISGSLKIGHQTLK